MSSLEKETLSRNRGFISETGRRRCPVGFRREPTSIPWGDEVEILFIFFFAVEFSCDIMQELCIYEGEKGVDVLVRSRPPPGHIIAGAKGS